MTTKIFSRCGHYRFCNRKGIKKCCCKSVCSSILITIIPLSKLNRTGSFCSVILKHSINSVFVDRAEHRSCYFNGYPAVFTRDEKFFRLKVRVKMFEGFLIRVRNFVSHHHPFSGNIASTCHFFCLVSSFVSKFSGCKEHTFS
jgi:hypothetical protein